MIADQFASNGYVVVIPDLFEGDPLSLSPPPGFDIHQWLKVHSPKEIDPIVEKTLAWTRQQGADFVGAAGYCIGAKVSLKPRKLFFHLLSCKALHDLVISSKLF